MTEQRLQQIIRHYHIPQPEIFMTSQPISKHVRFAKVWDDQDFHHLKDNAPYHFYLIFDDQHQAIGAVFDMKSDLHWFIEPAARKKGHLTRAMLSAILPHLSRFRKAQQITIDRNGIGDDNFEASLSVAKACKFRVAGGVQNKTYCSQSLQRYKSMPLTIKPEGMSFDELAELRKDMNNVVAKLWQIQATLQMRLGESRYSRELMKATDLLNCYRMARLEDALYDFKDP